MTNHEFARALLMQPELPLATRIQWSPIDYSLDVEIPQPQLIPDPKEQVRVCAEFSYSEPDDEWPQEHRNWEDARCLAASEVKKIRAIVI